MRATSLLLRIRSTVRMVRVGQLVLSFPIHRPGGAMVMIRLIRSALVVCLLAMVLPSSSEAQDRAPEDVVRALMAVWESGDTDRLDGLFHPDATYVDKPNAREFHGVGEIRGYVGHVHSWAAQVALEVTSVRSGSGFAVAEWVMTGVQDRPISGMIPVATNRSFSIHGTTMVDVEDGRASRAVEYIQVMPLMLQLGARIELPGGVVIGGGAIR